MKTDIQSILKAGAKTVVETIDYSTPERKKELIELKKKSQESLSNKYVSQNRLNKIIIKTPPHAK